MQKLNILITAGPTIETIDPVRYISNYSSGKMGYALALACVKAGHHVTLISGPTRLDKPKNLHFIAVDSARQMHEAVLKHFEHSDLVFKVAAVADYRVQNVHHKKIKKSQQTLILKLVKNPDILKDLGQRKRKDQILVGFAAETHSGITYARKKLKEKNLDWIVLNEISKKNIGFGSDLNQVTLIASDGKKIVLPSLPKDQVAKAILNAVLKLPIDLSRSYSFKDFDVISWLKLLHPRNWK